MSQDDLEAGRPSKKKNKKASGSRSGNVRSHAEGASIVQVGLSERTVLFFILFPMIIALGIAAWALNDSQDAREQASDAEAVAREAVVHHDDLRSRMIALSAKYEVLQYDHQALKGQLVARGIYEGTEH